MIFVSAYEGAETDFAAGSAPEKEAATKEDDAPAPTGEEAA